MKQVAELISPKWDDVKSGDAFIHVPLTEAEKERNRLMREHEENLAMVQALDFDQSKFYFYKEVLKKMCPGFVMTQTHKEILSVFHRWLWREENIKYRIIEPGTNAIRGEAEIDLKKGFLLIGSYGTGKTTIMQAMSTWSKLIDRRPFNFMRAKTECHRSKMEKSNQVSNKWFRGSLCIDEIGHERDDGKANIWGNKFNYIGDLIEHRYDNCLTTHGTSNIDIDHRQDVNLLKIYGGLVHSRLHAMFNVIYLNGKDWRI